VLFALTHRCTIQARVRKVRIDYSGLTGGVFAIDDAIEGGTSEAVGIVDRLLTGGLVLRDVEGIFMESETITNETASAISDTVSAFETQGGTPDYYWGDDQIDVPCRFYTTRKPIALIGPGQFQDLDTKVIVPPTVTITPTEHRITSATIGFAKTFRITGLYAAHFLHGINHYEATLEEVPML
jgi:hypothetical protein